MASEQTLEKAISRDGTAIGYFRSGAGRPLVLVHGTTADHTPIIGSAQPAGREHRAGGCRTGRGQHA